MKIIPLKGRAFLLCLTCFSIFVAVIYGCRKDIGPGNGSGTSTTISENLQVIEAKSWYDGNKVALASKITLSSEADFLKILADFTPDWENARTAADTNYYVVEAPAIYARKLGIATNNGKDNINNATRLLVLKSKRTGVLGMALMHIHSDADKSTAGVHYMDIPAAFSGNVFYTTLQGAFIYGYIFKDGKVAKESSGTAGATKTAGPHVLQLLPGQCETVVTDWYDRSCYYNTDNTLNHCTDWQYLYSTVQTYCEPTGGTSGGGPIPSSPPPCPPRTGGGGTPPGGTPGPGMPGGPAVESVGGKIIVFLYDGDPTPPGGGTVPCEIQVDTAKIIKNFCDGLREDQKVSIVNTIKQLQNSSCASKYLYNELVKDGSSFSFCIQSGSGSAYYNAYNKSISFTTDYASTRVDILEHELFHAYQDKYYPGGTKSYGKDPTTGVASAGFSNIEFEQAVFTDILYNSVTAFDKGTIEQQDQYRQWLNTITDNSSTYPHFNNNSTEYNNFINQYSLFLSVFNTLPGNELASQTVNLNPTALITLLNQTNCN